MTNYPPFKAIAGGQLPLRLALLDLGVGVEHLSLVDSELRTTNIPPYPLFAAARAPSDAPVGSSRALSIVVSTQRANTPATDIRIEPSGDGLMFGAFKAQGLTHGGHAREFVGTIRPTRRGLSAWRLKVSLNGEPRPWIIDGRLIGSPSPARFPTSLLVGVIGIALVASGLPRLDASAVRSDIAQDRVVPPWGGLWRCRSRTSAGEGLVDNKVCAIDAV